jgi:hypothetical protein
VELSTRCPTSIIFIRSYAKWKLLLQKFVRNVNKRNPFDHIIPLDFFNLTDATEFKLANHWGNLQPLLIFENLSKGANIPEKTNFKYIN